MALTGLKKVKAHTFSSWHVYVKQKYMESQISLCISWVFLLLVKYCACEWAGNSSSALQVSSAVSENEPRDKKGKQHGTDTCQAPFLGPESFVKFSVLLRFNLDWNGLRNYCFLGNPGTGKTTVARLFAGILHDSELRSKNVFQESGAQKVKDDGIDEFRKLAQSAMDGVLFIDEAYDLDPVGDKFKGAPIVNELVTLTENERARLTCILAGYEDLGSAETHVPFAKLFKDWIWTYWAEVVRNLEDFPCESISRFWFCCDSHWVVILIRTTWTTSSLLIMLDWRAALLRLFLKILMRKNSPRVLEAGYEQW